MQSVPSIIEREIAEVSRFIAVLRDEQETLKSGQIDDLTQYGERKAALVEQLNALSAQRQRAIGQDAQSGDPAATEAWLSQQQNPAATENWKKLLELAREAKALNALNAKMVEIRLRQTGEILTLLTQSQENAGLYGASGQTLGNSGSRIVDSA